MASSFDFEVWATEYELNDQSVTLLKEKGFNSFRSLSLMSTEIVKKELGKSVLPGHLLLVQAAVESLQSPRSYTTPAGPEASNGGSANPVNNNVVHPPLQAMLDEGKRLSAGDILAAVGSNTEVTSNNAQRSG